MYVALANFAFHGATYFVGDEVPFAQELIDAELIGYSEELEDEADGPVQIDK